MASDLGAGVGFPQYKRSASTSRTFGPTTGRIWSEGGPQQVVILPKIGRVEMVGTPAFCWQSIREVTVNRTAGDMVRLLLYRGWRGAPTGEGGTHHRRGCGSGNVMAVCSDGDYCG